MTQNLKIEVLTGDISFDGMVVTNLVTKEELSTAIVKKADLGADGKIPTSQLPAEIVNTAGIVDEVKLQLETSIKDSVDESNAYAESYTDNALSSKADLTSGKVPLEQLPAIDQYPQFGTALNNLSTSILTSVKQRTDQLEKSKADLGEDGKVLREQIPSYEKISGLPEQLEVMSTQTAAVSGELDQHKLQTADQIDILKENIEANVQQLTDRQSHLMRTYATKELGVDAKVGVKPGEYFYVRSANEEEMVVEYQNVSGVPTPSGKSYPSTNNQHNNLKNRDADEAHPASAILDVRGKSQQQINDLHYQTDIANVKYWGAKGDGVTDDSDAIQACVDAAIARQSNRIYFPFDLGEKYRLAKTIYIMSSGFHIDGNRTPTYRVQDQGGYIFADDDVVELFNYNNGQKFFSNQLMISGLGYFHDKPISQERYQTFLRFNANNNGPHRGVIISRCCGRGFKRFLDLTVTDPTYLSAANVVVHDGCVFSGGNDVVYAGNRLFNLLVSGIQAEQGAKFTGFIDGAVSIRDSMLEGQSNTITIESNSPSVIIENNYTEYTAGEYFAKISGTNNNAYFEERNNFISTINSTDYYLLTGVLRFKMMESPQVREDRVGLVTLNKLVMAASSVVTSSVYVGTTELTDGFVGMCRPESLPQPKDSAVFTKNIASDVFDTPFGSTKSGLINTGVGAYTTLSKTWNIGDIITVVALVKSDVSQTPIMQVYNQSDELQGTSGGANIKKTSFDDWHVIVYSRPARVAGTSAKIRFSTGVNKLKVAAIGVDVTPASEFKVFNGKSRAEVRLFNPFVNQDEQILSSTESFAIPEIAAGGTYTRSFAVAGAAIGDVVVMSPNVDLLGLDWFVRVSNTNNVQLRIVNRTASPISVGASTWRIRVMK